MNEPRSILREGTRIVTHTTLGSSAGIFVRREHIAARRPNASGTIRGWVAGHGGDVYWVEHADGATAVYCWSEFELAERWYIKFRNGSFLGDAGLSGPLQVARAFASPEEAQAHIDEAPHLLFATPTIVRDIAWSQS